MVVLLFLSACVRPLPCTHSGQVPSDVPRDGIVKKRCRQLKKGDAYFNDGPYYEWYDNDQLATQGEYTQGVKTGRWIEYDRNGVKLNDRYLKGKEAAQE